MTGATCSVDFRFGWAARGAGKRGLEGSPES